MKNTHLIGCVGETTAYSMSPYTYVLITAMDYAVVLKRISESDFFYCCVAETTKKFPVMKGISTANIYTS